MYIEELSSVRVALSAGNLGERVCSGSANLWLHQMQGWMTMLTSHRILPLVKRGANRPLRIDMPSMHQLEDVSAATPIRHAASFCA